MKKVLSLVCVLLLCAALIPAAVAEEAAYTETVVSIPNGDHDIPATVCVPNGEGKFPAVVMLHGTGSNRDEAGNGYKMAAPVLAEKYGIATVRIDFMGSGDSTADYTGYTFESAVSDAAAAAAYMQTLENIDADKIGVMLGQNTGTHRRVTDKALHLFRGEMPEPVDLFSLKDPGGNIFANRAVRQPGEQNKMAYQIVFAASFHRLAPFNACSCRCSHYKTGGAGNQFEISPVFHSRGASFRECFSPGTFLHPLQRKRFRPKINFFQYFLFRIDKNPKMSIIML